MLSGSVIRTSCSTVCPSSAATPPARQPALPHPAKFAACALKAARRKHVAQAVGGSWPVGGERLADRAVQAEATLQAERPTSVVDESLPRLHVGPPAFIKATGRIVASE
jgi:hypothetical protein